MSKKDIKDLESLSKEIERITPEFLLKLYLNKKSDQLSESFLKIFSYFQEITFFNLTQQQLLFINSFIDIFLFLFIKPDYILTQIYAQRFIKINPLISNMVAISSFKTTDPQLEILKYYPHNLFKILTLYSARNRVNINPKTFFEKYKNFGSLWYIYYFLLDSFPSALMNSNIVDHINDMPDKFVLVPDNVNIPYFVTTYYDTGNDKKVRQKINSVMQKSLKNINIINKPQKNKIAIITEKWFPDSVVYRSSFDFINSLLPDYDLTLIHLGGKRNDLDTSIFNDVKNIIVKMSQYDLQLDLSPILENNFNMAFYLDIGMTVESIYLSNLRIAPIQVTGYGHPVSTFGSCIDYFIGGSEVENTNYAEQNYSERLVVIPGIGAYPVYPADHKKENGKKEKTFILNCPWGPHKFNYQMMQNLKQIIKLSNKKIMFRFLPSFILNRQNRFIPFKNEILSILGNKYAEVINDRPHEEYMNLMEEGDISIDSYPFGGYNTIVDSLYLSKPVVAYEGNKAYNRLASSLLKRVDLKELIVNNKNDYIQKVVKLINEDDYRNNLIKKIKNIDLKKKIFNTNEPLYFKKAIDYLISNHDKLKKENSNKPIIIK